MAVLLVGSYCLKWSFHLRNECLFSRFMGNESQCGTNKSREHGKWIAVRNKQIAWTAKRFSCDLFVPHCDSFPMNREKKDTHSLYLQCLLQRFLLKFSEQSKKFKFPSEIGNLTLFPDKSQNSAWINGGKGDMSCMFFNSHFNSNNINSILELNYMNVLHSIHLSRSLYLNFI